MDNQPYLRVCVDLTMRRVLLLIPSLALGGLALRNLVLAAAGLGVFPSGGALLESLALAPLAVAGVMGLGRTVLRRPVMELDEDGIRIRPPWPVPGSWDRTVAWGDLDRLEAASMCLDARGWRWRFDHLWVIPKPGVPVRVTWWDRVISFLGPGSRPEEGYRVGVSGGWTSSVGDVVTFARRFRPRLRFVDARPLW